jgi:glycosyltransferase involved in cell wall biosynthesis
MSHRFPKIIKGKESAPVFEKHLKAAGFTEDAEIKGILEGGIFSFSRKAGVIEKKSQDILEAMAAGTPVVAANVGGNPELVEDGVTGMLVSPGDCGALAEAILRLACDPALRHQMGAAARERAESEFSVARQVQQTQAVYEELVVVS